MDKLIVLKQANRLLDIQGIAHVSLGSIIAYYYVILSIVNSELGASKHRRNVQDFNTDLILDFTLKLFKISNSA